MQRGLWARVLRGVISSKATVGQDAVRSIVKKGVWAIMLLEVFLAKKIVCQDAVRSNLSKVVC